jgi:hypothetical protein
MTGSGSTYVLEGHESDLKSHAGQKVEVTGTLDSTTGSSSTGATGATSSSSPTAQAGATGGTASATAAQRLRVSSVRMISADCSASGK